MSDPAVTESSVEDAFHQMTQQFIESSMSAWPEDTLLPLALAAFKMIDAKQSLALFQEHFGAFTDRLSRRDYEALVEASKNEHIAALDIAGKYSASNDATKEVVWTYICNLCRFSSMQKLYKHIPPTILGAVTDAAHGLKAQLDAGTVDVNSINPFELGQQVMAKFNPDELEKLMKGIMGNPETMNMVMSQMSSALGGIDPSSLSSGNLDISALMKMMPKP